MKRCLFLPLLLSLLFIPAAFTAIAADDSNLGQIFYDKAVSEYLEGSRDEAILSMEKSIKYAPGNNDAKRILARLLVQRSSDFFYENEIEKSFIDIKEAKELLPRDSQVDRLYNFVKAAFEERFKTPSAASPGKQEQKELVKYMAGAYLEGSPGAGVSAGGFTKGQLTAIIAAFGVGILALFLAVLMAFDRLAEARKHDIYAQRIELERVKWALSAGKGAATPKDPAYAASLISSGLSKAPPEMERLLKNDYLAVRAKGLIILEAEMLQSEGQKKAAARLLDPLLADNDPLVAANAARAMCGANFGRGMAVLEKMSSGGPQELTAALHVLGWLPSDRAVRLLMKHASEKDGRAALAAVKGLSMIKQAGFTNVSHGTTEEAKRLLSIITVRK